LVVCENRKYFEYLTGLQRTVINKCSQGTDPWGTPESTSEGGE